MTTFTLRNRRAALTILLLTAPLVVGCGTDQSGSGSRNSTTTADASAVGADRTSTPATPSDSDEPSPSDVPKAWPAGLPLPTASDPAGVPIAGSLVTNDDPPSGDVILFTFEQADGIALQSAFTGLGKWAQDSFEDWPDTTPCLKDEASRAALSGAPWDCGGKLPDGRFIQVAARVDSGRMTFDVLVKVA